MFQNPNKLLIQGYKLDKGKSTQYFHQHKTVYQTQFIHTHATMKNTEYLLITY